MPTYFCSVIVFPPDTVQTYEGFMRVNISSDIFTIYDDEIDGILLSRLTLHDQDEFSGDELLKIQFEINEFIEKKLVTQEEMKDVLKLIQFAIDNHRRVLFTPFNWNHVPLAQFE